VLVEGAASGLIIRSLFGKGGRDQSRTCATLSVVDHGEGVKSEIDIFD